MLKISGRFHRFATLRFALASTLTLIGMLFGALSFAANPAKHISATQNPAVWSVVDSPNNTTGLTNYLIATTCISTSDCWSVGYTNQGASQTLIEHWNGKAWSVIASPNGPNRPGNSNSLTGIACTSTSNCWAVGGTLIEHWDGTAWSVATSPQIDDELYNVTCVTSSDCWAVGGVIEHWDGAAWSLVNPPTNGALYSVTCVDSSDCWAAGGTLIEHWDGSSWTVVNSPNPSAYSISLSGIACVSASQCWAVGNYSTQSNGYNQTLIEQWDGNSWSIATSPNGTATRDNYLYAISCNQGSSCWAVGYYDNGGWSQALIVQWSGNSWNMVNSPNTNLSPGNNLQGVTCISASTCWAVGSHGLSDTNDPDGNLTGTETLTEQWDGTTWTIVPSTGVGQSGFIGVTCNLASDCWAVGDGQGYLYLQTLIAHWDGQAWTTVSSPTISGSSTSLNAVTCSSFSDCWAVGQAFPPSLIEHWNGIDWEIVPSPNDTHYDYDLSDVTCVSGSDCWVVGHTTIYYPSTSESTLTVHWDGTSWSVISSPNAGTSVNNYLYGGTCNSTSDCWAVGYARIGNADQTLIERWNGSSWSVVSSPNTNSTLKNHLRRVKCSSPSQCWAVGIANNGTADQPLILQWNGSAWLIVSSPSTGAGNNHFLAALTCPSSSDCWAAGYFNNGTVDHTLIEQWNGSSWSIVNSPNTDDTQDNDLFALTCVSPSECWAAGFYSNNDVGYSTLVEHYTASPLQIINASHPSDGHFLISGQSPPQIAIDIQVSPDLISPFTTLTTITSDTDGFFQYDDSNPPPSKNFYRAAYH